MAFNKETYREAIERYYEKWLYPVNKFYLDTLIKVIDDPKIKEVFEAHKEDILEQLNPFRAKPLDQLLPKDEWELLNKAAKLTIKKTKRAYLGTYIKYWLCWMLLLIPVQYNEELNEAPTDIYKYVYPVMKQLGITDSSSIVRDIIITIIEQHYFAGHKHVYLVSPKRLFRIIDPISLYYKFKNFDIITKGDQELMNYLLFLHMAEYLEKTRTPIYRRKFVVDLTFEDIIKNPKKLLAAEPRFFQLEFSTEKSFFVANPALWIIAKLTAPPLSLKAEEIVNNGFGFDTSYANINGKKLLKILDKRGAYEIAEKIRESVDSVVEGSLLQEIKDWVKKWAAGQGLQLSIDDAKSYDEILAEIIRKLDIIPPHGTQVDYKGFVLYPGFTDSSRWNLAFMGFHRYKDLQHLFITHSVPIWNTSDEWKFYVKTKNYSPDFTGDPNFFIRQAEEEARKLDSMDLSHVLYKRVALVTDKIELRSDYPIGSPIPTVLPVKQLAMILAHKELGIDLCLRHGLPPVELYYVALKGSELKYGVLAPSLTKKVEGLMRLYTSTLTEEENLERFKKLIKREILRNGEWIANDIKDRRWWQERQKRLQRIKELKKQKKKKVVKLKN
jgi:hypothetical protein